MSIPRDARVGDPWWEAIRVYLAWRRSQGKAEGTVALDETLLHRLLLWVLEHGVHLPDFRDAHASQFIETVDIRLSARGRNMTLQASKSFGEYQMWTGVWPRNPFRRELMGPKREMRSAGPKGLSEEESGRLLASVNRKKPAGIRDYLAVYILGFCGLRVGELVGLRASDVDTANCLLRVRAERTGQERLVPLPHTRSQRSGRRMLLEEFSKPMVAWEVVRRQLGVGPSDTWLATVSRNEKHTEQGKALTVKLVQQMVLRYGRRAGIERRVHPHALRHTAGYIMAKRGMPAEQIAEVLGHTSLRTCLLYCKLASGDIAEKYADAQVTSSVRVPTRSRKKLLGPSEMRDVASLLDALGLDKEALREER